MRAPAGEDIHAGSQEEIAVSILAEIVQLKRGRGDAKSGSADPRKGKDPICGMSVDIERGET